MCRTISWRSSDGSSGLAAQVALKEMSGVPKDRSGVVELATAFYGTMRVRVSGFLRMRRLGSC